MSATAQRHARYRIGNWHFIPAAVCLRGSGEERRLTPQQLRLLWAFIEAPEQSLSKQQMIDQVWGGRIVTDDAIARTISELRKQLDSDESGSEYIRTQHGHGYRLVVEVRREEAIGIDKRKIAAVFTVFLLGVATWLWLAPSSSREGRLALSLSVEPLHQTLNAQREYVAIAPAGTQIWYRHQSGRVELRRTVDGRELPLWQSRGHLLAARGSPQGSRMALVQADQDCNVIGIDLDTTDLHRWASCSLEFPPAIGWRDEQTLLTARLTRDGMLELAELSWPGAPVVRRIPAADCRQPLRIAQRPEREPLLSCRTDGGAALYRVGDEALLNVLVYRSIRLWVEDNQGRVYLASAPAWQPGITRYDPESGEFAYARTGYIADLAYDGDDLIAVRARRNLDLLALDLRSLSESVIEGGAQMSVAFTVDRSSGELWRLDDRAGRLAVYAGEQPMLKAAQSDVDLAQVVAMVADLSAGWLVLTTLNADRYEHHWLTLDPVARLARFDAGDAQLNIGEGIAEYVDANGDQRAFELASGSVVEPMNTVTLAETEHCPGSPLVSAERTIEILSEADGAQFRELDAAALKVRRRWRDTRIVSRCGLRQPRLDESNERVVYGHLRDANKELLRIHLPSSD